MGSVNTSQSNSINAALGQTAQTSDKIQLSDLAQTSYISAVTAPKYWPAASSYSVLKGEPLHTDKESAAFILEPVVPISYAGDTLYDEITKQFSYISNITDAITNNDNYKYYISYAIANAKSDVFHYSNSIYSYDVTGNNVYDNVSNSFITKYEDITCKLSTSDNYVALDENTDIDEYIKNIQSTGNVTNSQYFLKRENYTGAFLYPDLGSLTQVMTDGGEMSSVVIKPGESISIPLTFEYFIDNDSANINSISKKIIFAVKDSVMSDGKYYELEVIGNVSNNFTDSIYSTVDNYSLSDSLTDE